MYLSPVECGPFMLTGGSDMNIRFWDMNNPLSSYVVAGAAIDTHTRVVSYRQVSDRCRPTVHIATQRRNVGHKAKVEGGKRLFVHTDL